MDTTVESLYIEKGSVDKFKGTSKIKTINSLQLETIKVKTTHSELLKGTAFEQDNVGQKDEHIEVFFELSKEISESNSGVEITATLTSFSGGQKIPMYKLDLFEDIEKGCELLFLLNDKQSVALKSPEKISNLNGRNPKKIVVWKINEATFKEIATADKIEFRINLLKPNAKNLTNGIFSEGYFSGENLCQLKGFYNVVFDPSYKTSYLIEKGIEFKNAKIKAENEFKDWQEEEERKRKAAQELKEHEKQMKENAIKEKKMRGKLIKWAIFIIVIILLFRACSTEI